MDTLTFIVRIVEAIAWPVAVGLIFWALRGNIGGLIGKIRRFKWKDTEVAFSEELDRAEADLAPVALLPPVESSPELEKIAAEAQLPPTYIVQQAWLRVERAIDAATKDHAKPSETSADRLRVKRVIDKAIKDRAISSETSAGRLLNNARRLLDLELSPEDGNLLKQLGTLRNEAVRSPEPNITVTDALRYKDLAEALARRIEEIRPQRQ